MSWQAVGGWEPLRAALPASHFSFTNVSWHQLATWSVTIIPIWFIGNTLYQRIYSTKDVKSAQRAFYIAGLLEWPAMALVGTMLGLFSRVLFPNVESEMGLPMLIKHVMPVGVIGIMLAAYFSAIMSTADSCLLASVGHVVTDVVQKHVAPKATEQQLLRLSRWLTVVIGGLSVSIALFLPKVLDAVLLAYSFMVSGLFVPTLAGLFWPRARAAGALASMLTGGGIAIVLHILKRIHVPWMAHTEPAWVAIPCSALVLVLITMASPMKEELVEELPGS
jgi:solute:Na+ symporter, SSS family